MTFAAVLLLATLFGPERPITTPEFGPAYGTQYPHALASDGTDFLALWTGIEGVYATAVDERGATRPTPPRALFSGSNVLATWAGDAYVLVWLAEGRTLTARVNRDAQLVSAPTVIAESGAPVAIASLDGNTLVVVARESDAVAILIGSSGNIVRKDIAIPTATRLFAATAVASGGGFVVGTAETTYAPTHEALTIVRATRLSAEGTLEHSVKLHEGLPNNVNTIHAASDGDRVGMAFVARRNMVNGPQRLHAFTIDARTLAVTGHAPRTVIGDDPQVVATPRGFAAGLLESRQNAPLLLTTIEFATDERHTTQLGHAPAADLRMATNGRTVLSVWRDYRFSPPYEFSTMNMFGLALDATAAVPETGVVPVAISAVAQTQPSIASAGGTALVAWMDLTKTVQGNVVARRVDARGNMLDAAPLTLAVDVDGYQQPVVVFTGELWMVAWSRRTNSYSDVRAYLRRIALDGTVLDPTPVDLGPGRVGASASNGTITLLTFGKTLLSFSRTGDRIGTIALPDPALGGSLASNGREFLIVWEEGSDLWQWPSPNFIDLRAIRLDANGAPLDVVPIDIAISAANERAAVISSNGTDFLVVYEHDDREGKTIRAKRVLRTGVVDPGSVVARGESSHAVTPRGDGYLAVFTADAILAVALDARGAPVDGPVTLATSAVVSPSTAAAGSWIAYSRSEPSLGQIERVYVRSFAETTRRRTIRK